MTKDKALSAHFEHTVVVTEDGCRILTLPEESVAGAGADPSISSGSEAHV